ncbi:anaerobic glycerol-3-phosphate dehydrogenase subunit C [mine drainage metagenome]|uniref:Anaerobic glycerol-3-phosphate dehydrogenase subunit C n=1 Tax=mine drainage metagenome TaxID=410659 RepID=A0A1J5SJ92_9ZZZZ
MSNAIKTPVVSIQALQELAAGLEGELHFDETLRKLYATDASEYQELPVAVALPRSESDVRALIDFANRHHVGLIPRGAGTSLAGQVVGSGLVVDLGKHLNRILDLDTDRRRVRVQPGVVRNELNLHLKPHGLLFGPETSTANRAMIGGMVGNNSCGSNSIVYGSTRDHLVSARGFLSDGSMATIGPLTPAEFEAKCAAPDSLETRIYRLVRELLGNAGNRDLIRKNYPRPEVTRRNTGYALDLLMDSAVFDPASDKPFNLCRLIAGSEGTLFLGVEFELNCEPLPPPGALLCAHFSDVPSALKATLIAMAHRPFGCELIDRHILECTKANLEQAKNRFFVQGDPGAILVVEVRREERSEIERELERIAGEMQAAGLGTAFPVLWGDDCGKVWELRRAGQGLVNNVRGPAKPREIVEDTAVAVADLPAYIAEFDQLLRDKYGLDCIYYAHAGAGELHTRPLFNLKSPAGLKLFRDVATDIAALVKKYRGSLSGEHGDGRLRGEFIRFMVGDACYAMMRRVKETFDPANLLNPGKIIDTPPMDTSLRHRPGEADPAYETFFDFSSSDGVLAATEKCTGVGECRKSHLMGGTMCPSYMATHDEKDSTRARANILRHVLTHPRDPANPWDSEEVGVVMDLCLSCKACKSECPSNVDVARLKMEWMQHEHDAHGVPRRSRLVAGFARSMRLASFAPWLYNGIVSTPGLSRLVKTFAGFAPERSLPRLHSTTLAAWHAGHANPPSLQYPNGRVHLFCDEFTNYSDTPIGIKAVELLNRLGYEVVIPRHVESGRAHFSKGLVREARKLAIRNVELLKDVVTDAAPLIGIEPSAILGFRDEYPDLMPPELKAAVRALAGRTMLVDEFLAREADAGRIRSEAFQPAERTIKLHGHCHQKALSSLVPTVKLLELPKGHRVQLIPSACCGMAGSFGYEAEHYAISQQIGELVLLPAVRSAPDDILIAAPGTSCRHQIKDATGRIALHPVEILHAALR